jgi:hypothetical protein
MSKRRIVVVAALVGVALLAVLFYLRWPRLHPHMVAVTLCRVTPDGSALECECRMQDPCEAILVHHAYTPGIPPPGGPRILVERTTVRREQVGKFTSRYDWLRGEYVVTLRFAKGTEWSAESAGSKVSFPVWSRKPPTDATWDATAESLRFREGGGFDVLALPARDSTEALQLQVNAAKKPS